MDESSYPRKFTAEAAQVAFPLGGIGTGTVSLGARGELRDWEIFNSPAKGLNLPNTFFAIRGESTQAANGESSVWARIVEGVLQPPYPLSHGYHPATNAGLPRFRETTMQGTYPFASIDFKDRAVPVTIKLEAFNPLLPLNPEDSGIPCAVLTYTVTNISEADQAITLVGSVFNPVGGVDHDQFHNIRPNKAGKTRNTLRSDDNLHGLYLSADGIEQGALDYGSVVLATDQEAITAKPVWLRGAWYDFLQDFWSDLVEDGQLDDLGYEAPPEDGRPDTGSIGAMVTVPAGQSRTIRFIQAWHFPNRRNGWDENAKGTIRNHYATRFNDAWDVAAYVGKELPRLESISRKFHDALHSSTLPASIIDAVSANIVPVRSNTCFWLEDGRFFGWEGCFDDAGCCMGSCTHVWSYTHTVAFLFPSLEREMRRIEFNEETDEDGYMAFRSVRTFDPDALWGGDQRFEAAVDGQMGSILRAYREYQLTGDRDWLASLWPSIKRSIDYAAKQWDSDGDGLLEGKQHNTYDIEFYGPNPLCGIYYLAALRAVEAMAQVMDEADLADHCHSLFESGSAALDASLWNGESYIQKLADVNAYKYQHGIGCLSDQLLGQLHARVLGLGDLLPAAHIRTAIKSIFDHNYRQNFYDHVNPQRTYVLNDEAGLLLCSWPNGGRPDFPFPYADEVWTGFEYQVAAHLIYEGWVHEGIKIIESARARHDGIRRNPWNEVECGHHYARTMSSWAILLALTGQQTDLGKGEIHFNPVLETSTEENTFTAFWSTGKAWGTYTQKRATADDTWQPEIEVLGGDATGTNFIACGQTITL